MASHEQIYQNEVELYDQLISKQPDLTNYIYEIRPFHGLDILDLGAGSGRFACSLARKAKSIICTDSSESMLHLLEKKLKDHKMHQNWSTIVADHRKLPIHNNFVDLVISGWSICYLTNTGNQIWEMNLAQIISEMERVLRPGGTIVIFETMGTGTETPNPPEFLKPYYRALTEQYGFLHRWIRADYVFNSMEEAKRSTEFFFGEELTRKIEQNEWSVVPECAGIWWKHLKDWQS